MKTAESRATLSLIKHSPTLTHVLQAFIRSSSSSASKNDSLLPTDSVRSTQSGIVTRMSKSNAPSNKGGSSNAQKHLHSRVSYLYRAASYLASRSAGKQAEEQNLSEQAVPESTGNQEKQEKPSPSAGGNVVTPLKESTIGPAKQTASQSGSFSVCDEASVRLMLSHVKRISRKSQLRLSSSMKQSICKRCHVLLVNGRNATQRVENLSRGGKKPWATVLVVTCNACEAAKHFPLGAKRPPKKKDRSGKGTDRIHPETIKDHT